MVWPITGGKSYVGETGKSMRALELVGPQQDGWRNIPISLIDLGPQENNRRKLKPFGGVLIGCPQRL
jgi:hypothetical protein